MNSDRTASPEPEGSRERLARCEAELAAAEARNGRLEADRRDLAAIVEGSRDAIWSWAPDGTILRWNAAAHRLLGYSANEIVGRTLFDLVPHDHKARALDIMRILREGNSYGQYETVRLHKDGTPVEVELTISPIFDEAGVVVGASTACRDITERKQFENSLAKRVNELTTLYELTERLQRAKALPEIYQAALDAIVSALGCDRASILLFDSNSVMRFVAWRGLSEAYRTAVDGHSPWTADAIEPKPIFMSDILTSDEVASLKATVTAEGIRALAFVPLVTNGKLIGKFMTYHGTSHQFTDNEMNLASTIARQLALSIGRQIAEEDLRHSEARFRLMAENAPVMIWISDPQGECLHLNQMLRNFWGVAEESAGEFNWASTIHPDDAPEIGRMMTDAIASRSSVAVKGRYLNAKQQYRVLETHARPRFSSTGEFLGMIGVNVDVTEREEAERARELLVAELNHRVKNTLSVVQGIAHQTFRSSSNPTEARKAFEGRLVALAHAHNLLTRANWENASLQDLAELTLDAKGSNAERVLLSGPRLLLPPREAVSIAMALHELCTNAMKYGALSNESGRINLRWARIDGVTPQLQLDWQETGGPPVITPSRRGFGSVLLERTLAQDLNGEVRMTFAPTGLVCSIGAPITSGERLQ
jgi:PAS domain S-box-containing protein